MGRPPAESLLEVPSMRLDLGITLEEEPDNVVSPSRTAT